jgi:hypothetical protein
MSMQRICVYCGSSSAVDPDYLELARQLGVALAERGLQLVYGGGGTGMMGAVAQGVLQAGGNAIGVTIRMFDTRKLGQQGLTELLIYDTMHERKAKMVELSDGFIALPGGLGTLDELVETLEWTQLGIHAKPVGVLNYRNYYDRFLSMLDYAKSERFLYSAQSDLLVTAEDPVALIELMEAFQPRVDLPRRWQIQTGSESDVEGTA